MAKPSTPSPGRSPRGEGKNIPIEDTRGGAEASRSSANPADTGAGSSSPSSEPGATAQAADPNGSAAGSDAERIVAEAEAALEGEPMDAQPSDSEQVAAAKAEAAEWQDKFLRLHAEWDTYRRRTTEQREAEKARAAEKLVSSLLPVLDDFERTIDYATKNGEQGLLDGVSAVHTKMVDVLKKDGVEIIDPQGEAFDALEAQAVATVDDAGVPDETVAEVYQKGYKMGSKVLRPAMVTVTSGGPKREKTPDEGGNDKK
ncbi:nucleotide exchange factor GrpE [Gordonibacter massiliensis (ex Traore et al. 2017)]|uniref:nucleotide exchange factor GrpE n=1 Tax=Gordonibacter massiliensis (ex Traore et al. 2017) TaxID=1841863 RepID=UPI001C8C833C|nr:nucleotide exchange factor GrpE [Gordonibacter massiliensis (ex Traore et al. 2017)]MBX9032536.1 nucleotide exchange factor GrpE [Gordonibacter massiliensis (ex Traore et al. 2017)]